MLFYDFEVFAYDWLVVIIDMTKKSETVIHNDPDKLQKIYDENINDIWVGFNSRHYDQYILKGILCGFEPKKINDYIIIKGLPGWKFSSLFKNIPLINYDVMQNVDRGLKSFEGFMGNSIKETSVPFDIDRPLTKEEVAETIKYCRHDVQQTIEVFIQRKEDFEAQFGLLKMFHLPLSGISKTKVQLSADILGARKRDWDDEFDIDFPPTLQIKKYTQVLDWYKNPANRKYRVDPTNPKSKKMQCQIIVAGVPHVFAWGGVHGAIEQYSGTGYFLNMDVGSLYPTLMCVYNLMSRSVPEDGFERFKEIRNYRLELKHQGKKKEQAPLKIVLNGTYGAMKDINNALYDPRQANRVCVYGQLLLLDLIEKLEPYAQIIQSNTDGILIKMPTGKDEGEWFNLIDDICYEWETRTGLDLEFDEYRKVFQKDVNNYIIVDKKGGFKSKGAYVKKLGSLDYDLPILNKALVDYMIHGVPIEETIMQCDDLKEFQLVSKISGKYEQIWHGGTFSDVQTMTKAGKKRKIKKYNFDGVPVKEKCVRLFASKNQSDGTFYKKHAQTGSFEKLQNSPEHCFMFNDEVNGVKVPAKLDKQWYIDFALRRLKDFGVV